MGENRNALAGALQQGRNRPWIAAGAITVAWLAFVLVYQVALDRRDGSDEDCFASTFTSDETSDAPVALGLSAEEALDLDFRQSRGVESDQILLAASATPPAELEVASSALVKSGHSISAADVHVRATSQRNTVLLDLCVDASSIGRLQSGTYKGIVTFTDERVEALQVPVEVSFQARYLWWLAPLVLLLPAATLYLFWDGSTAQSDRTKRLLRALVAGVGATAVVFGAQGMENPGWGGPEAAFGLMASMYAAAAAAAALVTPGPASPEPEPETAEPESEPAKPEPEP